MNEPIDAGGLPTSYIVRVREPKTIGQDGYGNDVVTEWDERDWPIHGFQPGEAMTEPARENRDQSNIAWTVLGPKRDGYPVTAKAEIRLPGKTVWYRVDGEPKDYTFGPWEHPTAGIAAELLHVEG